MRKAASLRPSPAASGAWQDRTPAFGDCAIPVTQAAGSGAGPPRHRSRSASCCSVPRLTRFTVRPCAGPIHHRCLPGADSTTQFRGPGFIPAVAGCRYRAPLTPRLVRPCRGPDASAPSVGRLYLISYIISRHLSISLFTFFKKGLYNRINYAIISECPQQGSFILLRALCMGL